MRCGPKSKIAKQGFKGSPGTIRNRKDRLGDLLTMFILTILYIPISKFAVDSRTWHQSLSPVCYSTALSGEFNWVRTIISMLSVGICHPSPGSPCGHILYCVLSIRSDEACSSTSSPRGPLQRGWGDSNGIGPGVYSPDGLRHKSI